MARVSAMSSTLRTRGIVSKFVYVIARADWSASLSQYTYNNDSILPVEQIDASTFSIPFDCTDGVWPWYPGDALYEGHLLLSINPVGILYGEMNSESETVFSSMPLSSSSTWRGGRYIDYDESISTLVFGYDVGDISEYPLTALGVEALFSNYIEGVWHSTDTIWDFTLYDLHITQARYENYRGNGYLSFDFYGDWEPNHKYTLESNQFSGFDREGVVLYIDGEEYLPYYG